MDELYDIAKAYYETANKDNKKLGDEFFKSMDEDGDGKISLHEFLALMKREGRIEMANPSFFKQLNKNGSGTLDFMEAMNLLYIIESGRKFCDGCGELIAGLFLSCTACFDHDDRSFNLCPECYKHGKYAHVHKKFLDNYLLLETKRLDALKEKKAAKKKLKMEEEKKKMGLPKPTAGSPSPSRRDLVPYNPGRRNFWEEAAKVATAVAETIVSRCTIM